MGLFAQLTTLAFPKREIRYSAMKCGGFSSCGAILVTATLGRHLWKVQFKSKNVEDRDLCIAFLRWHLCRRGLCLCLFLVPLEQISLILQQSLVVLKPRSWLFPKGPVWKYWGWMTRDLASFWTLLTADRSNAQVASSWGAFGDD